MPRNTKTNCVINGISYYREYVELSTGRKMVYGKTYSEWKNKRDKAIIDDAKGLVDNKTTFGDAYDLWFNTILSKRKIKGSTLVRYKQYRKHQVTSDKITKKKLKLIQKQDMINFFERKRAEGKSDNAIHGNYALLNMFFKYCVGEGYIARNPMANLTPPSKQPIRDIVVLEDNELNKVLNAAPAKDRLIYYLLAGTGLRLGEILTLRYCDIKGDTLAVNLTVAKIDKGDGSCSYDVTIPKTKNAVREIPIVSTLQDEIKAHTLREKERYLKRGFGQIKDNDFLFQTYDKSFIRHSSIYKKFRKLFGDLDIPYRSPHVFRHTFITKLVENGTPPPTVMLIAGHADIQTTMRYYHAELEYKEQAMNVIANIL